MNLTRVLAIASAGILYNGSAFATGMHPLRAGMLIPQLPGATSYLLPGTPVSHYAAAIKA